MTEPVIVNRPTASAQIVAEAEDHYRGWFLSNLIALDMLANTLLGGRVADTISARSGRAMWRHGGPRWRWPGWWVRHCYWAAGLPDPTT